MNADAETRARLERIESLLVTLVGERRAGAWMSPAECARVWGCSVSTARRRIQSDGAMRRRVSPTGRIFVRREDVGKS